MIVKGSGAACFFAPWVDLPDAAMRVHPSWLSAERINYASVDGLACIDTDDDSQVAMARMDRSDGEESLCKEL